MKTLITFAVAALFASAVNASDYNDFAADNPDLYSGQSAGASITASRPGVGDLDIYGGFDDGNADLFLETDGGSRSSGPVDVYNSFGVGNPDLM